MVDLKLAMRTLARTPFLTAVAVLSLALGIGANAAIFSIFDQILLQALPVAAPERLVNIEAPGPKHGSQSCNQAGDCDVVLSYPMLRDLEAAENTGLGGIAGHRVLGANIAQGDRTMDGSAMLVTGSYFAVPGVTSVTTAMVPVVGGSSWGTDVSVQGFESGPDIDDNSRYNVVGTDFFRTLETPLIAGREFTTADGVGASPVAIVNEAFAEKFGLERGEVVGSLMSLDDRPNAELDRRIVGLVQDAKYNDVKGEIPPVFVMPAAQDEDLGFNNYYVRTAGDPAPVLRAIPGVVRRLDPNLPVEDLKTMGQQIRENVFMDRFISLLSTSFAVLATLLAAIGLYGVLRITTNNQQLRYPSWGMGV